MGEPPVRRERSFRTTRWSVVLAAGDGDAAVSHRALEELCERYWYPLYAYVRRRGHGEHEALDLTQGYFARLLEKRDFRVADPARGRFRAFLLKGVDFYLANERERAAAQKRGGGRPLLSLDAGDAPARYAREPVERLTPARLYERAWALAIVERALERLRADYEARGRGALFARLRGTLTAPADEPSRAELAAELELTEGALKVAVHRLRKRFGERLRDEVAETLTDPADVDEEIRALLAALAS